MPPTSTTAGPIGLTTAVNRSSPTATNRFSPVKPVNEPGSWSRPSRITALATSQCTAGSGIASGRPR